MASPEEKGLRQGIQLTALDKDYRENPYQIFRELRERAPVHEDREMGRFLCNLS